MKREAMPLAALVALVLTVSGCTIPGTDIVIPGIPNIFGPGTIDYTNDIIIIKGLQVTPQAKVKAGQTLTLYADIQNLQDPQLAESGKVPVSVELYDYCTSLFEVEPSQQSGAEIIGTEGTKGFSFSMSPQEIKTVSWRLTPRGDIKLTTPCELKVKVSYAHTTRTVTSVTFINPKELEGRIRRGEAWQVKGATTRGYGPVKAFVEVETQQPVPADESTPAQLSITIKNVGQGYVKNSEIPHDSFSIDPPDGLEWGEGGCDFPDGPIQIIRKQSTPLFCSVRPTGEVDVEQTYDIVATVGLDYDEDYRSATRDYTIEPEYTPSGAEQYEYEFRKTINVQVEPRVE